MRFASFTQPSFSLTALMASSTLLGVSLILLAPAHAQVYNPVSQFDVTNNPAQTTSPSVWQYGYKTSLTGSFTLFDSASTATRNGVPLNIWAIKNDSDGLPGVAANLSNSSWTDGPSVIAPQELNLHPGTLPGSGTLADAVLRFVAPTAGTYSLTASFFGNSVSGTTTDVHVQQNSVSLFDGILTGYGTQVNYTGPSHFTLSAGDFLDFTVGPNGTSFTNDSTGLVASLTRVSSSAPEPSSLTLLGSIALLSLSSIRPVRPVFKSQIRPRTRRTL